MSSLKTGRSVRALCAPILALLAPMAILSPCHAEASKVVAVTTPAVLADAREPQVAVADNGNVFITYGAGDAVYCSASRDGGKTYSAPVKVADAGNLSLGMRRGPRIALAGKAIVISAVYGQQGNGKDGELLAWRSADGGKTWAGPARVSDVPGAAREGLHAMAASRDGGTVACAWLDLRQQGTQIYFSRSSDGGRTWSKNVRVYRSPDGTVCECCHPSLAFDAQGRPLVMWRNALGGNRDMYAARSGDRGLTFGPAEKIGAGSWPLNACPMDGGGIAVSPDGAVTTFWRRDQEMFACAPGGKERLIGRGQQGWVSAGPGGAYLVWLEGRPGRLQVMLPAGATQELATLANDPVVSSAPSGTGPVIVAWTAGRRGKDGIQSAVLLLPGVPAK